MAIDGPALDASHKTYALLMVAWSRGDWIVQVASGDDGVSVVHRLRVNDPTPRADNVWDMLDQKSWYTLRRQGGWTVEGAIKAALQLQTVMMLYPGFGELPAMVDGVIEETGDQKRFIAALRAKEWCHMKDFASKEEAERFLAGKQPS